MNRRSATSTAGLLPFKGQHGGRRKGAGRKPTGNAGVSHHQRTALAARFPVHVTVKLQRGLPRLRRREEYAALRAAFHAGCAGVKQRGAFRLCHYAVLNDHLHFLVEAHDRILRTPREVRNAIRYVLANGKKHAAEGREVTVPQAIDTFTSAPWFDGFRESVTVRGIEAMPRPVTDSRTWMLTLGWRRHGLLSVHELPATG